MKKLMPIMVCVAFVAFAVPASAGLITVIHALPALPDAVPSSNPVDIAIDGVCEYIYQPYGSKIGPRKIEAGQHSIIFYESIPDDPCQGEVLAARQGNLNATAQIDVVLGLNSQDRVVVRIWDNTNALDAIENGAETAVEIRGAAAGPIRKHAISLSERSGIRPTGMRPPCCTKSDSSGSLKSCKTSVTANFTIRPAAADSGSEKTTARRLHGGATPCTTCPMALRQCRQLASTTE